MCNNICFHWKYLPQADLTTLLLVHGERFRNIVLIDRDSQKRIDERWNIITELYTYQVRINSSYLLHYIRRKSIGILDDARRKAHRLGFITTHSYEYL